VRYLPVEPRDVLVIFDDMDLPSGKLRLRWSGGHGGHNGIRSVIEHLGTKDFPRMRIGVGRPVGGRNATGHLLSKLGQDERQCFLDTIERATDAVCTILRDGFEAAMNRFNAMPPLGHEEEIKG